MCGFQNSRSDGGSETFTGLALHIPKRCALIFASMPNVIIVNHNRSCNSTSSVQPVLQFSRWSLTAVALDEIHFITVEFLNIVKSLNMNADRARYEVASWSERYEYE